MPTYANTGEDRLRHRQAPLRSRELEIPLTGEHGVSGRDFLRDRQFYKKTLRNRTVVSLDSGS